MSEFWHPTRSRVRRRGGRLLTSMLAVRTEVTDRMLIFGERHLRWLGACHVRRPLQRLAAASGVAVAPAAPDIAGSRAGPWQDSAPTDPGRTPQRVRDGSLKPLISTTVGFGTDKHANEQQVDESEGHNRRSC
jgi:hypothetical protein